MSNNRMLTPIELEALNARIAANADALITSKMKENNYNREPKGASGPKPKVIVNPFVGHIWSVEDNKKQAYPEFAMDIIEGVCRLDWHDRPIGAGGISKPLSVKKLINILEWLPEITNEKIEDFLSLEERHARRYVKAAELVIPRMMKCRPAHLSMVMDDVPAPPEPCVVNVMDDVRMPTAEELTKLHHDMRTFTEYATAEEYERESSGELTGKRTDNVVMFPARKQHPKKAEALILIEQGLSLRAISKELGIAVNTVRSWQKPSTERQAA
ncbi:helix-turn-helix domain-containing protein [Pseudomonas kilonensis]|uniref:Homeodomain-like domain-containing protein n=1 Tax=Pseudomonas kilonensis TaxID=132476 RepID=A0ABY0Z9A2_9PSED|nr:helix-turn-helix domain-containing protein [Pseudomonas kilonensis]SEE44929.1 Homeodomain-like domain-containing protein [Pseudomonas kilonensis]